MTVWRIALLAALGAALAGGRAAVQAHQADVDRELEEAKALYRDASFSDAIVKLQDAIGRLKLLRDLDARRVQLADAYLHLALSYFALDNRAAAREHLKAMVRVDPERRLDPKIYAPPVIALWEEAKREVAAEPHVTAPVPAATSPATPAQKKSGSKTVPVLLGVGGAVAAGVAVAGGGGNSSGGSVPSTAAQPTPTPTPVCFATHDRTYVLSGAATPSVGISVDDILRVYLNGVLLLTYNPFERGNSPLQISGNTGDSLKLEAQDANKCYSLGPVWLQKDDGSCLRQLTAGVSGPACGSEPPKQVFFVQFFTLP